MGTEVLGVDAGAVGVEDDGVVVGVDEDFEGAGVGVVVADEGSADGVADAAGLGLRLWCPQRPAWCVAE